MTTKVCTRCKVEKPTSEFHKNSSARDGLQPRCKECASSDYKKRALANKLKNANGIDATGFKVCLACKENKPKSEFYKNASARDGLDHVCKSCSKFASKQRALANKLKNANGIDTTGVKVCSACKKKKLKSEFNKNASRRDGLQYQCKECALSAVKKSILANKLKNSCGIDMSGVKFCSACKENKPKGEFFKNASSRDGLGSRCKECVSRYARAYNKRTRRANEEARARGEDIQATEKYCSACGETKPSNDFYRSLSVTSGLTSHCKKCASQRSKAYRDQKNAMSGAFATKSNSRWLREDDQFVIENYAKMTAYQMAVELGRTRDSVSTRVRGLRRDGKLA